ncbi:hypothetical protein BC828DRAFT_381204 [Blastocladiella britannica]|nr:hypothetical protein BC828DRAFT_381204 [Blastocladiella britannica]
MLRFSDYGELPPFANAANKKLDATVREKERRLALLTSELEDHLLRKQALADHAKNVRQQLAQTSALTDARGREIETEEHLLAVADREQGRHAADLKRMQSEQRDVAEASGTTQNAIHRTAEKIAKIKAQCKSEERELDDWMRVQQEKDEDNLILLKYAKEDDAKSRELALQLEKLVAEVDEKRATLNQTLTETQVSQMEVERIAGEFRMLHDERTALLAQWEQAVQTMRKRDMQIEATQQHYEQLKTDAAEKQAKLVEKQLFLEKQTQVKLDTEKNIQSMDRMVGKLKNDQIEATKMLVGFQDELETLRTHLTRTSNDLQSKKNEVASLKSDVAAKEALARSEEARLASLHAKMKLVLVTTGTKEEKAAEIAEYLRQDEARAKALDKQIKTLKDQNFRHSQELFKLRQDEKTLQAEILGAAAALRNLASKIAKLDADSIGQRSLIYNQEYALQQLERKVKRAQGERTDEEQAALNARIAVLTGELDRAVETHTVLSTQLKRAQDDLRHAKRRVEVLAKDSGRVADHIDELNLYISSATAQLATKIREKEEAMVEGAIMQLEVRKLKGLMTARADEVLALETRQVALQCALDERSHEIGTHKQMLRAQIKLAEEERAAAAAELRERTAQVSLMKTRYEILMAQIAGGANEDDDNEGGGGLDLGGDSGGGAGEKTQAYYIIRAAQKREALQRQGDALDAKIQHAEREIKAMENTLELMSSRNNKFKSTLAAADVAPQDLEHRAYLQAQHDAAVSALQKKQATVSELQVELQQCEHRLAALSAEEAQEHSVVGHLHAQLASAAKAVDDAMIKKRRAESMVAKAARELRASRGVAPTELVDEETDIRARDARDAANLVLYKCDEVLERHTTQGGDVGPADRMRELLESLGIAPPSRPATRLSNVGTPGASRASSRAASRVRGVGGGGTTPIAPSSSLHGAAAAALMMARRGGGGGGGSSNGGSSPVRATPVFLGLGAGGSPSPVAGRRGSPTVIPPKRSSSVRASAATAGMQVSGALPALPGKGATVSGRSTPNGGAGSPSSIILAASGVPRGGGSRIGSAGTSRASSRAGR